MPACTRDAPGSISARRIWSSSWRQRRLPASALRGTGVPILGIDPAANVAEAAERPAPTPSSSWSETATRLAGEGKQASLVVGNNVLAQVPDLNDFVAGVTPPARRRHRHVRVPAPPAPARRAAVRHDLPRALLVLLVRRDRRRPELPRARGLRREELWTHGGSSGSSRSTVAAGTRRPPRSRPPLPRGRRGASHSRALRPLRRGREGVEARLARPPHPPASRGKAGRRLRGAREGNTLLNYCGIRTDLSTSRSTATCTSTVCTRRAPTSRSILLSTSRGRDPTTCSCFLEPGGRDRGPTRVRRRVGGEAHRPRPARDRHRAGRRCARLSAVRAA